VIDHSEPPSTTAGNAVLRWILAPFGAAGALGFGYLVTYFVFALLYGAEMKNKMSAPVVVSYAVALVAGLVAWTWAGSRIAPPSHRRLALGLFSAPVVLITMALVAGVRMKEETPPNGIAFVVGSLLACAGILVLAFHPRFAAKAPEDLETPRRPPERPRRQPEPQRFVPTAPSPTVITEPERPKPVPPPAIVEPQGPQQVSSAPPAFKPAAFQTVATSFGTRNRPAADASHRATARSSRLTKQVLRELIDPLKQSVVAADLATYFGPNSEVYLNHYGRMVREQKTSPWSWNWPGFLTGYVWFFYRRMYAFAFTILILPIILSPLMSSGGALGLAFAVGGVHAKTIYVQHGFRHILRADRMGLTGDQRVWYLRSKGGVSRAAATFAGLFLAITVLIAILAIVYGGLDMQQLPRVRNA
jgi:hypothetical protein